MTSPVVMQLTDQRRCLLQINLNVLINEPPVVTDVNENVTASTWPELNKVLD